MNLTILKAMPYAILPMYFLNSDVVNLNWHANQVYVQAIDYNTSNGREIWITDPLK